MPPSQLKQLKAAVHQRRNGVRKNQKNGANGKKPEQAKRPKSFSEETRRRTLLPEMQRRNKVGGIVDRRIGENDPTMAPEDRALQRYVKQKSKKETMFNLEDVEDDEMEEEVLTHRGERINTRNHEDFHSEELEEGADEDSTLERAPKRRRLPDTGEHMTSAEEERPKTKKEVMDEVIKKSKLYKYERQKEREEDEDIREELDKGLPDLLAALRGKPTKEAQPNGHANGFSNPHEKDYDKTIRELAADQKAKPTDKTMTEEQRAEEVATRLKDLEEQRLRRMRGEPMEIEDGSDRDEQESEGSENGVDEAAAFGLKASDSATRAPLDVEDEDDFIIDSDLVASGSDIELDDEDEADDDADYDDDDTEFLKDVRSEQQANVHKSGELGERNGIAYTYPCPQNHAQLLEIVTGIDCMDLAAVIQRIRALYHPQLHSQNKEKLSNFACSLVDHLVYLSKQSAPLAAVEAVIRHIHSLAKAYGDSVALQFKKHLQRIHEDENINRGDLVIFTAIGSIYPPSDHFHQIVTPAITIMARWLGLTTSPTAVQLGVGAYLVALCIRWQRLSKRYVPEALRFTTRALQMTSGNPSQRDHVANLLRMAELWSGKSAFVDLFSPAALEALESTQNKSAIQQLTIMLEQAQLRRRNLELHHHRPLAIKTAIPKFEESFNPEKHYDPDKERSEAKKLKAEYKKEKKGALRELKKDASFIAREKLRAKKEADAIYAEKQRKLIAEIQSTEGAEQNRYEREKMKRKGRR